MYDVKMTGPEEGEEVRIGVAGEARYREVEGEIDQVHQGGRGRVRSLVGWGERG